MLTIVGGGSTGLITLSVILEKNLKGKVYEATNQIGGVLRDVKWENSYYFSGCQYLSTDNIWFKSMPDQDLLSFNQNYASFTDLFGPDSISRNFSGPVCDDNLDSLNFEIKLQNSIYDKIMSYPSLVREGLLNWLTMLGINPRNFHTASLKPLGVSRVHFRSQDEKVDSWRGKEPLLAEYFGIPFANHGLEIPAVVPRYGFSSYFDNHFYSKYSESIAKNSPVKIEFHSGSFKLTSNKSHGIDSENILWSGNPNPIFRSLGIAPLESFNFKCQLICGEVTNWDDEPFYVQVYSRKSKVFRIYLYKVNGLSRFTIERASGPESIESACYFAKEILSKLDLQVKLVPRGIWKQNRFNLFTLKDYEALTSLEYFLKDTNLISGSWQENNRSSKISKIIASYVS